MKSPGSGPLAILVRVLLGAALAIAISAGAAAASTTVAVVETFAGLGSDQSLGSQVYTYDDRPNLARPPPVEATTNVYGLTPNCSNSAEDLGRVGRVFMDSGTDFVAPQTTPLREIGPKGDPGATGLFIKTQKQQEHILGTPNHANRIKQGGPVSVWDPGVNADGLTRHAWQNGTPVPGPPGRRDFEVGSRIGGVPGGGSQTTVRVHMDGKGLIHGHPAGRQTMQ